MATLANLVVRITGNTAQLDKSVKKAETRMDKFKKGASKALKAVQKAAKGLAVGGAAALAGFAVAGIKTFTELGDQLDKMSQRTGFSVESLGELKFAAEQSGASLETIEKAAKRMAVTILDANSGSKQAADSLALIGLNAQELARMNPEQQFQAISTALSAVRSESNKAALAQKIFGRAGAELVPLMNQGAEGVAALRAQAQQLGVVMSGEAAKGAADFADAQNELKSALAGLFLSIGSELVPVMTDFIRQMIEWKPQLIAFFTEAKATVQPFVSAFMTGVQTIWPALQAFFSFIFTNKPILIAAVVAVGAAVVTALGPVSLAALAIVGIVTLIGFLKNNWQTIWAAIQAIWLTVSSTIAGIYQSQWGWMFPGGPFIKAILFIKNNWMVVWNFVQALFSAVSAAVMAIFHASFAWMFEGGALHVALEFVKSTWDTIWNAVKALWETVSSAILGAYKSKWGWILPQGPLIKAILFFKDNWQAVWKAAVSAIQSAWGVIKEVAAKIQRALDAAIRAVNKIRSLLSKARSLAKKIPGLAQGGTVTVAGSVLVGERGPELLTLPQGAQVTPLSSAARREATQGAPSGGGDTYYFYSLSAADFRREVERIMNAPGSQARAVGRP